MKIEVPHKSKVEVEIDEFNQKNITFNYLEKVFNWDRDYFIDDNKVKKSITIYSSHSWESVEVVREATKDDFITENIFNKIKLK